ncbi:MAG: PAS domain S-box protein, partial [Burkholderiales bacterium]|nr:PAS domain S-box protein [Burkholderiales bacterium]
AYESRRVTRAGDVIDVEISFVPMRDHDGHITGQLALTHDISARKQLVQALRREEARWRLIVESAPHGVIIVDHNGRITLVNRQAELSFGYTRDEMVGSPIEMLLPMAIRDDHVTVRTAYLRHPEARKMGVGRELFGRRKDGSDMSVEVGLSPLESGSEVFIVATVVDITERREAEQRLASERSLLRTLIDALPDLVFTKDLEGRYVLCNAATLQHVGARTPEDVIGQRIFDVYERDLARQYHDDDEQVLRGATVLNREERGVTADGREVWFLTTKVPIRAADGTVTGLVGVSRDITTRRAMADALSLSETRFRHLVESLPQLIWTCSPDGLCDFLSPQWVAYTGVPAENHLGLGWIDQVHPEDREATITAWLAAVTGDRDLRLEFRLKRHDGVYRWFDMRAVRQRDAAGRIVKWFGSNTDIQERRHGDELLRRAQKMEALGTLAGGIAHDFNNILLAITGNAKLAVEDTAPDHPARESLLEIEAAANRAGELVARILSFSRQQDGRLQSIRLQPVIEEVLRLLRATLPATIEIRPRFAPDAGFVSADSTQIHQVLMNLATNAAHAIDNRPGAIEILLDSVDVDADFVESVPGLAPGPHVRLSVIDNGCGMTSDIVERVFDPFFTTKPPGQGTGLGLSVVHGIVRQHHGAITVYSEPRRGTTF